MKRVRKKKHTHTLHPITGEHHSQVQECLRVFNFRRGSFICINCTLSRYFVQVYVYTSKDRQNSCNVHVGTCTFFSPNNFTFERRVLFSIVNVYQYLLLDKCIFHYLTNELIERFQMNNHGTSQINSL